MNNYVIIYIDCYKFLSYLKWIVVWSLLCGVYYVGLLCGVYCVGFIVWGLLCVNFTHHNFLHLHQKYNLFY